MSEFFGSAPFLGGLAFIAAFVTSGLMIYAGVGDTPNARSSHNRLTPTSGGVGIVAALAVISFGVIIFHPHMMEISNFMSLLSLCVIMAMIGLYDDIFSGAAKVKFIMIAVLGAAAVWMIGPPQGLPLGGEGMFELPYGISFAGAVLWIFVVTNGVNFMDGANGLMAGSMLVASAALMIFAYILGASTTALLAAGLSLGLLGFLPYNFRQRALIFCGDIGSLTTGFVFAIACLILVHEAPDIGTLYLGPLLLLPFLCDVLMTMAERLKGKDDLLAAHNKHFYQLLIHQGWTHEQKWSHIKVSWLYIGLALLCAALAALALLVGALSSLWTLLALSVFAASARFMARRKIGSTTG